jgi:hypothetical protein
LIVARVFVAYKSMTDVRAVCRHFQVDIPPDCSKSLRSYASVVFRFEKGRLRLAYLSVPRMASNRSARQLLVPEAVGHWLLTDAERAELLAEAVAWEELQAHHRREDALILQEKKHGE